MHKLLHFDETQLSFFVIHAFDVLRIHCQIQVIKSIICFLLRFHHFHSNLVFHF